MNETTKDIFNQIAPGWYNFRHRTIFQHELDEISRRMPTFSLVNVLSDPEPAWKGEKGRLNEALLRKWVPDLDQRLFWISGPPPMVTAYKELVKQTGVGDEAIRTDSFAGY